MEIYSAGEKNLDIGKHILEGKGYRKENNIIVGQELWRKYYKKSGRGEKDRYSKRKIENGTKKVIENEKNEIRRSTRYVADKSKW